jgi:DNA primase
VIEEAKAAVPTVDLADRLCGPGQLRRIGGERWTALCPLPGHHEKTPSFVVYPGDRGWWCYGCQRGGDVVDLAQAAWGIDRADEAAAEVLMTFGHPIPERPPRGSVGRSARSRSGTGSSGGESSTSGCWCSA